MNHFRGIDHDARLLRYNFGFLLRLHPTKQHRKKVTAWPVHVTSSQARSQLEFARGHSQIHRPWGPYAPSPLAAGLLIAVRFSSDMKRHVFLPVSRVLFNRSTLQKLQCVCKSLCLHKCIALCKSVLCIWQRHINKFV